MRTGILPNKVIRSSLTAVRPFFRNAKSFDEFYKTVATKMTPDERAVVVEQAILLLEGFYVHLPLKCAMYAVDPMRRLRLLQQQLEQEQSLPHISDLYFQREMMDIFASLRDQHTGYNLPAPYDKYYAWLPFKVEACYVRRRRKYLVTRVVDGFDEIRKGAEIISWNGIPIERALELAERQTSGGNAAARRALALFHLTIRPLSWLPPPEEEWVKIGYRSPNGQRKREVEIRWVVSPLPSNNDRNDPNTLAISPRRVQHIRKILFAPDVVEFERKLSRARNPYSVLKKTPNQSIMPDFFAANPFSKRGRKFGYIRIFSFETRAPDDFLKEFVRLVSQLQPEAGLIVDVRDNPGGKIEAAERLVQLIAPVQPVHPQVFYFINTPRTLQLCELHSTAATTERAVRPLGALASWTGSIQRAMETGATYSSSFPISRLGGNIRLPYQGPVLVVTNALSYSAAEMFAAGFQDHGGTILGTDEATGGGGANVRSHREMRDYFRRVKDSPFEPLPMGADMSFALRRSQRVGAQIGSEIEDFGVVPNEQHYMTTDDLLFKNRDLIDHAVKLLLSGKLKDRREARLAPSTPDRGKASGRKFLVSESKVDGQRLAKSLGTLANG